MSDVPCSSLLGVCRDLDGKLHGLLEGIPGALIHRLHRLNIDACHDQVVGRKAEAIANFGLLVQTKHRGANDFGRVLKEDKEEEEGQPSSLAG